jgi:GxxExxY protein
LDENDVSHLIIGAAIEVHRVLGPGLLESAYRLALAHELRLRGHKVDTEVLVAVRYKDLEIPGAFRIDLLVEGLVVVELKAVEKLMPMHEAQLLTYLRCSNKRLGLLLNFHESMLKRGVTRVVNQL